MYSAEEVSRFFGYRNLDASQNIPVLFPVLDYVNHWPRPKNSTIKTSALLFQTKPYPSFVIIADRNQSKGSEFVIEYKNGTNIELLSYYGFVVDKNPDDYFSVSIPFPICYEKALKGNGCRFSLAMNKINVNLLRNIRTDICA